MPGMCRRSELFTFGRAAFPAALQRSCRVVGQCGTNRVVRESDDELDRPHMAHAGSRQPGAWTGSRTGVAQRATPSHPSGLRTGRRFGRCVGVARTVRLPRRNAGPDGHTDPLDARARGDHGGVAAVRGARLVRARIDAAGRGHRRLAPSRPGSELRRRRQPQLPPHPGDRPLGMVGRGDRASDRREQSLDPVQPGQQPAAGGLPGADDGARGPRARTRAQASRRDGRVRRLVVADAGDDGIGAGDGAGHAARAAHGHAELRRRRPGDELVARHRPGPFAAPVRAAAGEPDAQPARGEAPGAGCRHVGSGPVVLGRRARPVPREHQQSRPAGQPRRELQRAGRAVPQRRSGRRFGARRVRGRHPRRRLRAGVPDPSTRRRAPLDQPAWQRRTRRGRAAGAGARHHPGRDAAQARREPAALAAGSRAERTAADRRRGPRALCQRRGGARVRLCAGRHCAGSGWTC